MSIIVAFSGGLDTSFCVPYLKETYDTDIITVTVNTGGFSEDELAAIEKRSIELGAIDHYLVEAREQLFRIALQYLIKGNVLRGGTYPLCVGPDRVVQAMQLVRMAQELGAGAVAHGSTGAGNDQIRFDVALGVLGKGLNVIAPIRELGLTRSETSEYLRAKAYPVEDKTTDYSVNFGLWGVTIGGKETLGTSDPIPDEAWPTRSAKEAPDSSIELTIGFEKGIPVSLNGSALQPVELIEELNAVGYEHAVGRGMHVGDTILGIKGRVAFQAPAASILITAHKELEKIVLSRWQQVQKNQLGDFYGTLLHEAQYFDPVMRNIEAFLDASQETVTGNVTVHLYKGSISVLGAESSHSLFNADIATYGEANTLWDGRDAQGFSKIIGIPSIIAANITGGADLAGGANDTGAAALAGVTDVAGAANTAGIADPEKKKEEYEVTA